MLLTRCPRHPRASGHSPRPCFITLYMSTAMMPSLSCGPLQPWALSDPWFYPALQRSQGRGFSPQADTPPPRRAHQHRPPHPGRRDGVSIWTRLARADDPEYPTIADRRSDFTVSDESVLPLKDHQEDSQVSLPSRTIPCSPAADSSVSSIKCHDRISCLYGREDPGNYEGW